MGEPLLLGTSHEMRIMSSDTGKHVGAATELGTLALVVKTPGLLHWESPTAFVAWEIDSQAC